MAANRAKEQAERQLETTQNESNAANEAKNQALTQNAALQTALEDTQNELNQVKENTDNQQQTIADLQQQLQDQQEQNRRSRTQLVHQIEQNEDRKNQYLFDIGIKNRSILFLVKQINNLEQELGELNRENESLRDELEEGLNGKNRLQNRLSILLNQKQILQKKLAGVNEKSNNLAFEWEKERQKNADLQNQNSILFYQSQFLLRRPSQRAYQSLKRQKAKQQENYTRQINNLQQKLTNLRGRGVNLIETRDNHLTELNELDQDFRDLENLLAHKNSQLVQKINEKNDLQTQLTNQQNINQTLQNQINNHAFPALPVHTCSPCSLTHLPEPHVCRVIQDCSHEDYGEIKEQQIIQSLNKVLGSSEKDLKIIISRIKELVGKPPIVREIEVENTEKIQELEKELQEKSTPFGENLATIKQLELDSLEQLFKQALDSATIQQIQQATSYQQVVAARQAFLQKHLEQQKTVPVITTKNELITQPNQERVILISLLVMSLVGMGGLLMKLKGVKISKILRKNSL